MSESLSIKIIPGSDLAEQELAFINAAKKNAFGPDSAEINPQPDNEDWTRIHFVATVNDELVAFARLKEVEVDFLNTKYQVLGIASVLSVVEKRGIGGKVVDAIREYIQSTGQTGLGFCDKKLSPWYVKHDYKILDNGQARFYYPTPPRFPGDDAIFVPGNDGLFEKMLQLPQQSARISIPHW